MQFAKTIVAAIIMIMVILVVAVPVMSGVSDVEEQASNELGTASQYTKGLPSSMAYDGTTFTVDGETVGYAGNGVPLLLATDVAIVRTTSAAYLIYGSSSVTAVNMSSSWSLTITGGSFTVTYLDGEDQEQTVTSTITSAGSLHKVSEGEFFRVTTSLGSSSYVNANSSVYLAAWAVSVPNYTFVSGKAVSGDISGFYKTGSSSTPVLATTTTEYNDDGSYTLTGANFYYNSNPFVLNTMIVPVDYYTLVPSSGTIPTLVGVIPLLLSVGVLIVLVGAFVRRD